VNDARCRKQRERHQNESTNALEPGDSAEKQPPRDDKQATHETAQYRGPGRVGHNNGHDKTTEPLQRNGHYAWPQAQRLARNSFVILQIGQMVFLFSDTALDVGRLRLVPLTQAPLDRHTIASIKPKSRAPSQAPR
jgi:hypothetical protein